VKIINSLICIVRCIVYLDLLVYNQICHDGVLTLIDAFVSKQIALFRADALTGIRPENDADDYQHQRKSDDYFPRSWFSWKFHISTQNKIRPPVSRQSAQTASSGQLSAP
jgi:hypothetical protein